MTADAISRNPDNQDLDLTTAEAAQAYGLGGFYRLQVESGTVEVELTDTATGLRSVVYTKPGEGLYLNLPASAYRVWLRWLTSPAGGEAVRLRRVSALARAALYAGRAWDLVRTGRLMGVVSRLSGSRSNGVTGVRAGASNMAAVGAEVALPLRPVMAWGEADPELALAGVSIIIPTKDRLDLLRAALDSLDLNQTVETQRIIVDNGATAPDMLAYLEAVSHRPDTLVVRSPGPFNFSKLCNAGAQVARHPLLLFLNDDVEALDGDWLKAMRDAVARAGIGVAGARLLYADRTLQHAGVASNLVPGPGHPWRGVAPQVWQSHPWLAQPGEVDAVTAACLLIRRDLFDQIGGFDEVAFRVTLNDVDLCLKARKAGYKVVYVPEATLIHKESQTRRRDDDPAEVARRQTELAAFVAHYPEESRVSCFYPLSLRRDTDQALPV